jgi:hypothetical protein
MRNYGTIFVLAAVVVIGMSCSRGIPVAAALVPGLTLPPGAFLMPPSEMAQQMHTEQNKSRDESRLSAAADMTGFNYGGDLEAVAAHFEKFLKPLGWKRLKPLYVQGRMGSVIQKIYYSSDRQLEIQISDWALQNAQNNDVQGKARYILTVVRGKLPNPATGELFTPESGDTALEDI